MKSQDPLHTLIRSLTQSEKRYFKISSSVHEIGDKNNYLRLFDELEKMETYDESILRKKFSGQAFLRQLPVARNYLFGLVMKSLRAFHAESSTDMKLRNFFADIEILYKRSMIDECLKTIRRAEKYARHYDKVAALAELEGWRAYISFTHSSKQTNDELFFVGRQRDLLHAFLNETEYRIFNLGIRNKARVYGESIPEETLSELRALAKTPLLSNEKNASTFHGKLNFMRFHMHLAELQNDYEEFYHYAKRIDQLVSRHPEQVELSPNYTFMAGQYLCLGCYYTGQIEKIPALIRKFLRQKSIENWERNNFIRDKVFNFLFTAHALYFLPAGKFSEGKAFYDRELPRLKRYEEHFPAFALSNFLINAAQAYLGAGDYSSCLRAVDRVLTLTSKEYKPDHQEYARFQQIMAFYAQGHTEESLYLVTNLELFLKKTKRLYAPEKEFISGMKKILRDPYSKDLKKKIFTGMHRIIAASGREKKDPGGLVKYIQLDAWCLAQAKGISLGEALRAG